jgi:kynurenine formamidase
MLADIEHKGKKFRVDLSQPLDISIPLNGPDPMVTAWYVPPTKIEPVRMGDWVGSVKAGASVNFNNIFFNPHGNGTHTECLGHITPEAQSVNRQLKEYFFLADLISLTPEEMGEDRVITRAHLEEQLAGKDAEALVIRTLPNKESKKHLNYSNTNPPYMLEEAAIFIREKGIRHLLIDLPSVDREVDEGRLVAHKAFWDIDGDQRLDATITELIYVRNEIRDGTYLLNIQFAPFENDASPSRPVLFEMRG